MFHHHINRYSLGVVLTVLLLSGAVLWAESKIQLASGNEIHLGWLLIPLFVLVGGIIYVVLARLEQEQQSLQNAKQYVDDLIAATPDALLIIDQQGRILRTNHGAQRLFGYSAEAFNQLTLPELLPERFRKYHDHLVESWFARPQPRPLSQRGELLALTREGEEIPVEISLSFTHRDGQIQAITSLRDARARKQAEARFRLMSKVLEQSAEGVLITDHDTRIIEVNNAFCHLTGYQKKELLNKRPPILHSGYHDAAFYEELWQQLTRYGHWKGEIWDRHKNGQLTPYLISISAVEDDSGTVTHYVAQYSDITLIKEKEQHLERLAHFDPLTGLANRMLFKDRLRAAINRARRNDNPFALLYIDLDGFKQVNDQLGHDVGDEVLVQVAQKMTAVVREDDTVARLGGDEFAIIFNELTDTTQAEILTARVLEALTFTITSQGLELAISASIGIALFPDHGDSEEALLHAADLAMYHCKHHGKRSYHRFDEAMIATNIKPAAI